MRPTPGDCGAARADYPILSGPLSFEHRGPFTLARWPFFELLHAANQEIILRWCRRRRPWEITSCAYLHDAFGSRSAKSQIRGRSGFERQKNSRTLSGSVDPQVASCRSWSITARHRATSPLEPTTRSTDSLDTKPHYHGFKFVCKPVRL